MITDVAFLILSANIFEVKSAFWTICNIHINIYVFIHEHYHRIRLKQQQKFDMLDAEAWKMTVVFFLQLLKELAARIRKKCSWKLTFHWIFTHISLMKGVTPSPVGEPPADPQLQAVSSLCRLGQEAPVWCLGVMLRNLPWAHSWRRLPWPAMGCCRTPALGSSCRGYEPSPAEAPSPRMEVTGEPWSLSTTWRVLGREFSPAFPTGDKDQDSTTHFQGSLLTFQIYFYMQLASSLPSHPSGGTRFLICN